MGLKIVYIEDNLKIPIIKNYPNLKPFVSKKVTDETAVYISNSPMSEGIYGCLYITEEDLPKFYESFMGFFQRVTEVKDINKSFQQLYKDLTGDL